MRRIVMFIVALLSILALGLPTFAVQPSNVGNADDRNGGASIFGPHCHFNLMASAHNQSPHGVIITGAIHQAHVQTGLPTGIFQATACPPS